MKWLITLAALLLVGCSPINAGTITAKNHHEAYYSSSVICTPSGKTTICIPTQNYHPERWVLLLKDRDETGWITVNQTTFDAVKVGNYYNPEVIE